MKTIKEIETMYEDTKAYLCDWETRFPLDLLQMWMFQPGTGSFPYTQACAMKGFKGYIYTACKASAWLFSPYMQVSCATFAREASFIYPDSPQIHRGVGPGVELKDIIKGHDTASLYLDSWKDVMMLPTAALFHKETT